MGTVFIIIFLASLFVVTYYLLGPTIAPFFPKKKLILNTDTENANTIAPSLTWWFFLILWLLTFIGGWIVVSLIGDYALAVFGLIVGILQWLLLRKQLSLWWVA